MSKVEEKFIKELNKEHEIILGFQEYEKQIADLKAKLAKSEKRFVVANNLRKKSDEVLLNYKTEKYGLYKTIQELRKMKLSMPEKEWYYKGFENCERQMSSHIADLTLENKQLKQQLENLKSKLREANRVKDKYKFLEEKNKEKREKDDKLLKETMASNSKLNLENTVLKQQLEESFTEKDIEGLIEDREKTIKFLQQQLAEKDKEIASLQVLIIENKNDIKEMQKFKIGDEEYDLTDEDARNDIKYQIENQTQLAIQELEKFRAKLVNRFSPVELSYTEYVQKLFEIINQQIKELKGK